MSDEELSEDEFAKQARDLEEKIGTLLNGYPLNVSMAAVSMVMVGGYVLMDISREDIRKNFNILCNSIEEIRKIPEIKGVTENI